jgi:hypothetical protein
MLTLSDYTAVTIFPGVLYKLGKKTRWNLRHVELNTFIEKFQSVEYFLNLDGCGFETTFNHLQDMKKVFFVSMRLSLTDKWV